MVDPARQILLYRVHCIRLQTIWGPKVDVTRFAWPMSEADWRQTPHGAPWDSNVQMAEIWLKGAQRLADEGLVVL